MLCDQCRGKMWEAAKKHLTDKERKVMALRLGIADGQPWTQLGISNHFNVTVGKVRTLEGRACLKLVRVLLTHSTDWPPGDDYTDTATL